MTTAHRAEPPPFLFLFDVDGVIVETPHEEAWQAAAVQWQILPEGAPFTAFYAQRVAGEPGLTGALNILESLRPAGGQSYFEREQIGDPAERLARARHFRDPVKQTHLERLIALGKFRVFDDIAGLVLQARLARIPVAAVSSSENARGILQCILVREVCRRTGVRYPLADGEATFDTVFDTTALGTIAHWHSAAIDKISHYAMAYGRLLDASGVRVGPESAPRVVVFEDAPKGIAAVSRLGFLSVGISRTSASGVRLASEQDLLAAGATLAVSETELAGLDLPSLMAPLRASHSGEPILPSA